MNIISNCCLGGRIYQALKEEFSNPFVWCAIKAKELHTLIENYYNIDFINFKLEKDNFYPDLHQLDNTYKIVIENKINVYYTHYRFDENAKKPLIKPPNVFYCKNEEYVLDKYTTRVKRMINKKEPPIYIILGELTHAKYDYNYVVEEEILKSNTTSKICLITNNENFMKYNSNRILIILDKNERHKPGNYPNDYCLRHIFQLKNFIYK